MIDELLKRPRTADGHGWCCFISGVLTSVTGSPSVYGAMSTFHTTIMPSTEKTVDSGA